IGGPLGWQIINPTRLLTLIGLWLTALGLCFAVWARFWLGRSWGAFITLQQDHKLVWHRTVCHRETSHLFRVHARIGGHCFRLWTAALFCRSGDDHRRVGI